MKARAISGAAVLVLSFGVAACEKRPVTDTVMSEPGTAPAATMAGDRDASDVLITTTVQAKYFASPDVKGHEIDVDTSGSVVTLTGKVENDQQKQQAVQIARSVTGVTDVKDQLTIATDADRSVSRRLGFPEQRSPGWITTKIEAQYYLDPELKPWRIDVTTGKDGVVTLTGRVDSAEDRAEAVQIARNTEGVTRVNDQLRVEGETAATTGSIERSAERTADAVSDGWITAKIQSRYFIDGDIKGRKIDVDTKNGVVTLRGTVGSNSEQSQALAIARRVDGVREVHSELAIVPERDRDLTGQAERGVRDAAGAVSRKTDEAADAAGRTADKAAGQIEDAWITTKVQSKYFVNDEVQAHRIDVDTRNGVVTLNGTVASSSARDMAGHLARETDGVSRVVNNLKIDIARR